MIKSSCTLALMLALLTASLPSQATLGQDANSAETDRSRLHARRAVRPADGYTVHEIQLPSGTVVREFVSPAGKVFAVSWQGPTLPDLQQILGEANFHSFISSPGAQRSPRRLRMLQQDQLVVQSAGRPRAFSGRAYVPGLVPPGTRVEDLK
jgi:hypothetical protein